MAEAGSWPSIERHGLLSTSALLDLFGVQGAKREALELAHRPDSVSITHLEHGSAVVRDQKPMSDKGLQSALKDGLTPREWYGILNARVFFWLTEARLQRLLNAKPYRGKRQTVLTLDTAKLLDRHGDRVQLSPSTAATPNRSPTLADVTRFYRSPSIPSTYGRRRGIAAITLWNSRWNTRFRTSATSSFKSMRLAPDVRPLSCGNLTPSTKRSGAPRNAHPRPPAHPMIVA